MSNHRQDFIAAAEAVLESAPCDCSHSRRYDDGEHLSGCYLFDLNLASIAMQSAPAAPPSAPASETPDGWCTLCGCGNNKAGFFHLESCPASSAPASKPRRGVMTGNLKPSTGDVLLIGGEHDGRRVHLQHGTPSVRMPKLVRIGVLADYPLTTHEAVVDAEEDVYRRQEFRDIDGRRVVIYVADGERSPFFKLTEKYPDSTATSAPAEPLSDDEIKSAWREWPHQSITSAKKAISFVRAVLAKQGGGT